MNTNAQPRAQIKRAARLLIAERGVRDVGVREIAQAAQQKNLGVVAYYFGTKDRLIAEILTDGAERVEAMREENLALLEAEGGPRTVPIAIAAIVMPLAVFSDTDQMHGRGFNRFVFQLGLNDSKFVDKTLDGRRNLAYQRCLTHLRRLLPELRQTGQSRRFVFLNAYIGAVLAAREAALYDTAREHVMWRSKETLEEIILTAAAILQTPGTR